MTYYQKIKLSEDMTGVPPETLMLGYVLVAMAVFWGLVAIFAAARFMW